MEQLTESGIVWRTPSYVKQLMSDLREQKKRRFAFLGASVTKGEMLPAGKSFVSVLEREWNRYFPEHRQPEILNAGKSGTLSGNAMFSLWDLLEQEPDLVFLDYSVNDTGDAWLTEAFESVVYHLINYGCAVVILLFCNQQGHCTRGAMTKIARHYGVPVLDIGKSVMEHIQNGDFSWEDFASDYVHPREFGHVFIADGIVQFLKEEERAGRALPPAIPDEFCFHGAFCDFQIIAAKEWEHQTFSYKDEFSTLVVEYTQVPAPSKCAVDIFVDGTLLKTIARYSEFSWDNRVITYLFSEEENRRHVVEIKPAAGAVCSEEELRAFQIVFGLGHMPE